MTRRNKAVFLGELKEDEWSENVLITSSHCSNVLILLHRTLYQYTGTSCFNLRISGNRNSLVIYLCYLIIVYAGCICVRGINYIWCNHQSDHDLWIIKSLNNEIMTSKYNLECLRRPLSIRRTIGETIFSL